MPTHKRNHIVLVLASLIGQGIVFMISSLDQRTTANKKQSPLDVRVLLVASQLLLNQITLLTCLVLFLLLFYFSGSTSCSLLNVGCALSNNTGVIDRQKCPSNKGTNRFILNNQH